MADDQLTRTCTKCGEEKPESGYSKDKARRECSECMRAYQRAWRAKHPDRRKSEKHRQWARDHRAKNLDRHRERERGWYALNAEAISERHKRRWRKDIEASRKKQREWAKSETYKAWWRSPASRAVGARRKALQAGAEGSFTPREFVALCERFGNRCLACRREGMKLTADHVVALSRGGSNYISNIQPLCLSCNSSKGAKTIDYRSVRWRL